MTVLSVIFVFVDAIESILLYNVAFSSISGEGGMLSGIEPDRTSWTLQRANLARLYTVTSNCEFWPPELILCKRAPSAAVESVLVVNVNYRRVQ
jgi:hypothetical protein